VVIRLPVPACKQKFEHTSAACVKRASILLRIIRSDRAGEYTGRQGT
jgi:hypothetical protein